MTDNLNPEEYVDGLSDRLLKAAAQYQVVNLKINKKFVPLLASDIIRGQSVRMETLPEDGLHAYLIAQKEEDTSPFIQVNMPAQMAQMVAIDMKAGREIRQRQH